MYKVYGKSNCSFCTKAVTLLTSKNLPFEYINIDHYSQEQKTSLRETFKRKTVPIILHNENLIGGYSELQLYLEETSGGFGDHFV